MKINIEVSDDKKSLVGIVEGSSGVSQDTWQVILSTKIDGLYGFSKIVNKDVTNICTIDPIYLDEDDILTDDFEFQILCSDIDPLMEYIYDNMYQIDIIENGETSTAEEAVFALSQYYCDEKISRLLASRNDYEAEKEVVVDESILLSLRWAANYNSLSDIALKLRYFEPLVKTVL